MEEIYRHFTNTDDAGVRTMDLMFLEYNMPLLYQSKSFALKVIRELRILLERILDHFEPQFLGSRYNRAF